MVIFVDMINVGFLMIKYYYLINKIHVCKEYYFFSDFSIQESLNDASSSSNASFSWINAGGLTGVVVEVLVVLSLLCSSATDDKPTEEKIRVIFNS